MRHDVFSFFGQYRFKNGKQSKNRICMSSATQSREWGDYGIIFCAPHEQSLKQLSHFVQKLIPYESLNILQLTTPMPIAHQIQQFIDEYVLAARRAYEAGFDGAEIQGDNHYLMKDQARLASEVIKACKNVVPKEFLIGFRILPENAQMDMDIDDNLQIAEKLAQDETDFITLSLSNVLLPSKKYLHLSNKPILAYFRERLGNHYPLLVAGEIQTPSDAQKALEFGASFVALTSATMKQHKMHN